MKLDIRNNEETSVWIYSVFEDISKRRHTFERRLVSHVDLHNVFLISEKINAFVNAEIVLAQRQDCSIHTKRVDVS